MRWADRLRALRAQRAVEKPAERPAVKPAPRQGGRILDRVFGFAADSSFEALLGSWLVMVIGFGLVYWLDMLSGFDALRHGATPVHPDLPGLLDAIYFSFVTATSIGFGDFVPVGPARVLAIIEGAAGLLIFGCVISKLVSRRQEMLTEEIHRISFETRLGRVRTNLHLVLSDMHGLATRCETAETAPRDDARARVLLESSAMVFAGELQAIHDLLYRPQQAPDESVMEGLLSTLAACMRAFDELSERLAGSIDSGTILADRLRTMSRLAGEICGECVPREYAPELKGVMDEIQALGRRLARAA